MHSLRQLSILVLVIVATGCGDATDATAPKRVSLFVRLMSVDGQPLPAVTVDIPDVITDTILDGTLELNMDGTAVRVTQIHRVDHGSDPIEYGEADHVQYRIRGDSIEVGTFGTCPAICAPNLEGTVSDSGVTLTPKQAVHGPPVFVYAIGH